MQNDLPEQPSFYGTAFSLIVILLAAYITQRFFLPLLWASILAIATWPLYIRVIRFIGARRVTTALVTTVVVAAVFIVPLLFVAAQATKNAPIVAHYVSSANTNGIPTPAFLTKIPLAGEYLSEWWSTTVAQPHGIAHLFSNIPSRRLSSAGDLLREFGGHIFHGVIEFGFVILCLFFFYLNGISLRRQIDAMGTQRLGIERWQRYARKIPAAIQSTVNGLVLVGIGEGILLGISYMIAGVPSPVLWGALTAALAIIPFGAPVAYLAAAALLLAQGNTAAAVGVAVWGTIVLGIADHVVRPRIIGGRTKVPFLPVLFGILGGVETLGLIGLFVGPVVMALFVTLWREPAESQPI